MLDNYTWHPMPGLPDARLYTYLRKVSVVSSNTAVIVTPGYLLVVDPGALPEQRDDLSAIIAAIQQDAPRQVIVLLTHCHVDHALQARHLAPDALIAIHEEGARFLAAGDITYTQAELIGHTLQAFQPELPLFAEQDCASPAMPAVALPGHPGISLRFSTVSIGMDQPLRIQQMLLDDGVTVTCFHTPGHGPDNCCFQIGSVLFLGDLLFAAKPFIAGIAGWDRTALASSIQQVRQILTHAPIEMCWPGHGLPMTTGDARTALEKLAEELRALDHLPEVNRHFLDETALYALALGEEASDIFTIIAGRLYMLAYRLEQLGENELAEQYAGSFAAEKIDECLSRFNTAIEELRNGKRLTVEVVLLALVSVQRIQALYHTTPLEEVIEVSLLRRATRLLLDFLTIARGLPISDPVIPVDLNVAVTAVLDEMKGAATPRNLLDVVDDHAAFLTGLAVNLARVPIYERMRIDITPAPRECPVLLPPERFADTLAGLLEDLAGVRVPHVEMIVQPGRQDCRLIVRLPDNDPCMITRQTRASYHRHFAACGVDFVSDVAGEMVMHFSAGTPPG